MQFQPADIRDFFIQDVPERFLNGLVPLTYRAYKDADSDCKEKDYPEAEYRYLLPHTRRVKMEFYVRSWARSNRLNARVFPNIANSAEHTRIRIGRFCITISSVDASVNLPRSAHFRTTYAKSPQTSFVFDELGTVTLVDPILETDEEYYYAILIHRPSLGNRTVPDLIDIAFPNPNYTGFLCPNISLLSQYMANLVHSSDDVEAITDDINLSIIQAQTDEQADEAQS